LCARDNVPTIWLASWPLEVNVWDGETLKGPVPTLFSEDPKATEMGLLKFLDKAHSDMRKMARIFFVPEYVSVTAAMGIVKKPRY
jgi:hypothetical protein